MTPTNPERKECCEKCQSFVPTECDGFMGEDCPCHKPTEVTSGGCERFVGGSVTDLCMECDEPKEKHAQPQEAKPTEPSVCGVMTCDRGTYDNPEVYAHPCPNTLPCKEHCQHHNEMTSMGEIKCVKCGKRVGVGFQAGSSKHSANAPLRNKLPTEAMTDTPGVENDHASTDKGWEREFWMLIDSTFEPNISGTDKHPDCVYTLSCVQQGEFGKELLSFIRSLRTQWVKEARVSELMWVLDSAKPGAVGPWERIKDRLARIRDDHD